MPIPIPGKAKELESLALQYMAGVVVPIHISLKVEVVTHICAHCHVFKLDIAKVVLPHPHLLEGRGGHPYLYIATVAVHIRISSKVEAATHPLSYKIRIDTLQYHIPNS